ncbi:DUF4249 domain-containing protein [Hymenobacter cavernae]|uniref:DUF4249 domain-containing protein n=1 Tax=Hymenobacter cavernae TaxID=2044852 RepID=A0ABQ1TWL4_9BACT|nr:DUF4249 domain-containing protein [Hymenobacter cavernae]GGF05555.1 hypothetical protein GCM10011383_15820 [Hymenobacter cavernae]
MYTLAVLVRALSLCCLVLLPGCIEPYMPEAISSTQSYLVVNGFINSQGSTSINLSRTYDIAAKTPPPIETGATLALEEEGGTRYPLRESTIKGTYTSANLALNSGKQYHLLIRTADGKEYASDYVPVKTTPAIDNINWQASEADLAIYVNTHDDTNTTQYYRWQYEETWESRPVLAPNIEYLNGEIQPLRTFYPLVCWQSDKSTPILVSNTVALQQDVVSQFLLRSFPNTTNRLRHKYSILVRQHALTREEYQYWALLKKNTENIGTLFDPLPAQLTGNVHCLNDESALALGYVSAHSVQEKRLFISRNELPNWWPLQSGYEDCVPPDTVENFPPDLAQRFSSRLFLPVNTVFDPKNGLISGYTYTVLDCIDCRKRGTDVRPSFWQ